MLGLHSPRNRLPSFALLCAVVSFAPPASAEAAEPAKLEYNRDVRPILADACFRCHGFDPHTREAQLRLDVRDAALRPAESSKLPIVPGRPEQSEVVRRITSGHAEEAMPPRDSHRQLTPQEIEILRRWIAEGAEYQAHWSLVTPTRPALPAVKQAHRSLQPIDQFVLAGLERAHVAPAAEADKPTLLRRVSLALTGLPATPEELDAFLADDSPRAYERVVDRLLASPRFGERMALEWLDAARYADTNGYYTDAERQAWPWRDWVIRAYNANLPFDRFTIEQLAGDLLPQATQDQRIATAFNRNHMVSNETGIIEEEYRLGYVTDRVDTTAAVWLGLTMGCARCHDHKFDPISQREYYQLFAAFNNIEEAGIIKNAPPSSPAPAIMLPTKKQEDELAAKAARRKRLEEELKAIQPTLEKELDAWERNAAASLPAPNLDGSIVYFPFDRDAKDHAEHCEASTIGTLPHGPGVKGQAARFDATQYVEFADSQPLERDRPFTLSVWILPGSSPQGCVASKMSSDSEARGFEILWYKSQPRINLAHRYGSDGIEVVAKQTFGGGQWRHLAVTYDGSSKAAGLKVYVDGKPSEVDVRRDALTGSVATSEPWRIGWKGTGIGFEGSIDEVRLLDRVLSPEEIGNLHWSEFLTGTLATAKASRAKAQAEKLRAYYVAKYASVEAKRRSEQAAAAREEEDALRKAILSVSVMQEMTKPRDTHVLLRGQYDQPGDKVEFTVPQALGSLPAGAPRNRLGFAQWLVSPAHPLTARVAVNRLWSQCFGDGLVRTANDFGVQGEAPTHPELLDWLAVQFRDGDATTRPWDVKALLKLIVMSVTFRQSSDFTPELATRDRENRLLARGPRFRLPAEFLRDQALAVGGLLVEQVGGPSVKPYQPPGLWEAVSYNGEATYHPDEGAARRRRGLYTYWKRQSPPPDILTFDGPTRETCSVRRQRTNTPLQALLMMNDVNYLEAAGGLGRRMMQSKTDGVSYGFRLATGREPKAAEVVELRRYHDEQRAAFQASPKSARALLPSAAASADSDRDLCELAAWTMTASLLLNLDETQTQH